MEPDRLTADILTSAMDAVIIMDGLGRVLYWNPAAEGLFGVATGQALGRDLAELVIPENLRERHRIGLARAAAGRRGPILGRRFEVAGLRRDGTSVTIELTVTRVEREGRTLFVGYLRDITERRRAIAELRASRRRLVAVSDETRRRLEHDLHDGAQQQLVSAAMSIAAAGAALDQDPPTARLLISRAGDQIQEAITGLRELARGLHPDVLSRHGLPGAVADLARRSGIVVLVGAVVQDRLPTDIEVAAYYVLAESLTNAAKHGARQARVEVAVRDAGVLGDQRHLLLSVTDDGPGGADIAAGSGLRGLMDRWAAVGGDLEVVSPIGGGTSISARVNLPGG
jgi:PAS domain S-box-containing protein